MKIKLYIALLAMVAVSTHIYGALVDWSFSATISQVDSEVSSAFSLGQTITGTFQYDVNMGGVLPDFSAPNIALWDYVPTNSVSFSTSGGYSAHLEGEQAVGTSPFSYSQFTIQDEAFGNINGYEMRMERSSSGDRITSDNPEVNGLILSSVGIKYLAFVPNAVQDLNVPTTAPDFASFTTKEVRLAFFDQDNMLFYEVVAPVDAVPEPATALSLLLGGGLLAMIRRFFPAIIG